MTDIEDPKFEDLSAEGIRGVVLQLRKLGGVLDYLKVPEEFNKLNRQSRLVLYWHYDKHIILSHIARIMPTKQGTVGVSPPRITYLFWDTLKQLNAAVQVPLEETAPSTESPTNSPGEKIPLMNPLHEAQDNSDLSAQP